MMANFYSRRVTNYKTFLVKLFDRDMEALKDKDTLKSKSKESSNRKKIWINNTKKKLKNRTKRLYSNKIQTEDSSITDSSSIFRYIDTKDSENHNSSCCEYFNDDIIQEFNVSK
jgi:hypothetical protein